MITQSSLPKTAQAAGYDDWQKIGLSGYAASILLIAAIILFGAACRIIGPIADFIANRVFHGPVLEDEAGPH